MDPGNYSVFCHEIGVLADVLLTPRLDAVVLDRWWARLSRYDYDDVHAVLEDAEVLRWYPFPKLVDLIEMIERRGRRQREVVRQAQLMAAPVELSEEQRRINREKVAWLKNQLNGYLSRAESERERDA